MLELTMIHWLSDNKDVPKACVIARIRLVGSVRFRSNSFSGSYLFSFEWTLQFELKPSIRTAPTTAVRSVLTSHVIILPRCSNGTDQSNTCIIFF